MEEKPRVKQPNDVKEVLRIMRQEFTALMGPLEEKNGSFVVHMVPCFLPGSGSFEVVNGFNLILDGACAQTGETRERDRNRVSVIEIEEEGGDPKLHSYIVTPTKFKGVFSGQGKGFYSYFFIQPAASGYSGTGPGIQKSIQNSIDNKIPEVKQLVVNVRSLESLIGLFYERGPIVNFYFPEFTINLGGFEHDQRFKD